MAGDRQDTCTSDSGGSSPQNMGNGSMARAVARAYNGGLGAELQAGSRGRAPGQRVRGQSPPEAKALLVFGRSMKTPNLPTFLPFKNAKKSDIGLIFAKNHGSPRNWGARTQLGVACAPPARAQNRH